MICVNISCLLPPLPSPSLCCLVTVQHHFSANLCCLCEYCTCWVEHCAENMHNVHLRVYFIYRTHISYIHCICVYRFKMKIKEFSPCPGPPTYNNVHMNWACAPLGIWVLVCANIFSEHAQVYLCVYHTLCTVRMCFLMHIAHAHVHCGSVLCLCLGCGFLLSIIIRVNIAPTCWQAVRGGGAHPQF